MFWLKKKTQRPVSEVQPVITYVALSFLPWQVLKCAGSLSGVKGK